MVMFNSYVSYYQKVVFSIYNFILGLCLHQLHLRDHSQGPESAPCLTCFDRDRQDGVVACDTTAAARAQDRFEAMEHP